MFGVGAAPDYCIENEELCFNFTAEQDDIKEEEEKFQLSLYTSDPDIEFCPATAHVAIQEDDSDGMFIFSKYITLSYTKSCSC